jgi:uncharacterized protein
MNLWLVFGTGLTTGGLSCLAVQGGLLASALTQSTAPSHETATPATDLTVTTISSQWQPVAAFLIAKLSAYTILGFLLGAVGVVFTMSTEVRMAFQIFTAIFMFGTAMNLLNAHPLFRYFALQPPKFLQQWVRKVSKNPNTFAPILLGLMTIFIPCGVTQAMEVAAMATGQPIAGALIMAAFVLGTSPLFATLGIAATQLSGRWQQRFSQVAAGTLLLLAAVTLNGALVVLNFPITFDKIVQPIVEVFSIEPVAANGNGSLPTIVNGRQAVTIHVASNGYSPQYLQVKAGIPVNLTLISKDAYSCALAFSLRAFNISTTLAANDQQSFTFTPTQPGKYTYTCSMGMYTGVLEVI